MTEYVVLIYAPDSAHALDATPEQTQTCDNHSDELADSGVMTAAYAMTPREMAHSVRGGTVTAQPFLADASHIVAGFYLIEAKDTDEAIAIAAKNPIVHEGGGVEIRQLHGSRILR